MSDERNIVVQDACILFDLVDLDLLEVFFQLDLTVLTTPQVIAEITDEDQLPIIEAHIQNGDLGKKKFGLLFFGYAEASKTQISSVSARCYPGRIQYFVTNSR